MTKKIELPAIAVPCDECQARLRHKGAFYCPHNKAGSVFMYLSGVSSWTTYSPVPKTFFDGVIKALQQEEAKTVQTIKLSD